MSVALDAMRDVLARPTFKGICAVVALSWSAFVHSAPDSAIVLLMLCWGTILLDTLLGCQLALRRGAFKVRRLRLDPEGSRVLSDWVAKSLAYSALGMVAFSAGLAVDILRGAADPVMCWAALTAANAAILGTEGLSILDNADALSGGTLPGIQPVRRILEQLRAARTNTVNATPNGPDSADDGEG